METLKTKVKDMYEKYNLKIEVISQADEAKFTALGCYSNIDYKGNIYAGAKSPA